MPGMPGQPRPAAPAPMPPRPAAPAQQPQRPTAQPAMASSPHDHSRPVTQHELNELQKHLDAIWKHLGIEFDFTRHFFDRVNDPRNKKQITIGELAKIFEGVYHKYGQQIANKIKPESEDMFDSVLTDMNTKVNSPVVVEWDRNKKRLKMVAKTVMRVGHFYAHPNQTRFVVQHYQPENTMKSKTYTELKEWVGFNTPEVAPIAAPQAVDDVDSAAFSVEQPEILDKLNAYCHEIANHQYINPYYPLNALWKKLSIVGINFNLKGIMLNGDNGRTKVPITRFGGRYGYLPHPVEGHDDALIRHDDGTGIPGGLELVVTWQKTGGVYTLNVEIEHGSTAVGFGEEVSRCKLCGQNQTPGKFCSCVRPTPTGAKQHGVANQGLKKK